MRHEVHLITLAVLEQSLFLRRQGDETVSQYGCQAYSKRREDAPDTPSIEGRERETALGHFSESIFEMRSPEITKKTSTPTKPPVTTFGKA
jgi:hypothetical protein